MGLEAVELDVRGGGEIGDEGGEVEEEGRGEAMVDEGGFEVGGDLDHGAGGDEEGVVAAGGREDEVGGDPREGGPIEAAGDAGEVFEVGAELLLFLAPGRGPTGSFSGALDLVPGGGLGCGDSVVELACKLGDAGFGGELWTFVEETTDAFKHLEFVDGALFHI